MSFRGREMYKVNKLVSKDSSLPSKQIMESVQKLLPNNKLLMNRAKRGLFAGKHIQFGNKVSLQGLNKSKRSWKPNVQEKRLFSYIHDRHIRVKVTTHAIRCIDKAGGIDECLLKTPYNQMDTELGIIWKAKIEKMYAELGNMNIGLFSREQEDKIAKGFEELKLARKEAKKKKNNVSEEAIQIEEASTEARTCLSQSHKFKGTCFSGSNCANVCRTEGFPGGECKGFRRRCFCSKTC